MSPRPLSTGDFTTAGDTHRVEAAALRAVAKVESAGSGFLEDGRPKILFEGQVFWSRLRHYGHDPEALLRDHPTSAHVLYPRWTREHYKGGVREYDRLEQARTIDPEPGDKAALESASWGKFQVMGYHWDQLGYASVGEFVSLMHRDEADHLDACIRYCKANRAQDGRTLLDCLRAKDWAAFARGYNGPGYRRNQYDVKLAEAYARYA